MDRTKRRKRLQFKAKRPAALAKPYCVLVRRLPATHRRTMFPHNMAHSLAKLYAGSITLLFRRPRLVRHASGSLLQTHNLFSRENKHLETSRKMETARICFAASKRRHEPLRFDQIYTYARPNMSRRHVQGFQGRHPYFHPSVHTGTEVVLHK